MNTPGNQQVSPKIPLDRNERYLSVDHKGKIYHMGSMAIISFWTSCGRALKRSVVERDHRPWILTRELPTTGTVCWNCRKAKGIR